MRGPRTAMKSGPHLPQLEKALAQKRRPNTAKKKKKVKNKIQQTSEYSKKEADSGIENKVVVTSVWGRALWGWDSGRHKLLGVR